LLIVLAACWARPAAAAPLEADEPAAGGAEAAAEAAGDGATPEGSEDAARADEPDDTAPTAAKESPEPVEDEADEPAEDPLGSVELSGYLSPGFGLQYRPTALPRDELEHGFFGSAGLIVQARPFEMWHGTVHLLFGAETVAVLTDVEPYGSGSLWTTKKALWQTLIEEATVAFEPLDWLGIKAGAMRMPFTLQQQSANTALLFPNRSGPNESFVSGADLGALVQGNVAKGILTTSLGVFNGDSLGLLFEDTVARGVVLSFRADVNPFGALSFDEGDAGRGPFRLGLGFGALWRPATWYDSRTGFEVASMHDVRMAAALRLAVAGFYFGAEYLRRQQVDDFTSRPQVADGAYGQMSYYLEVIDALALEPIARVGFAITDESFDPRLIGWMDGGLSFYPRADASRPDRIKLTLQYVGEKRFDEGVEAHGGQASARLLF